jgi:serine/threonine protein kinase
MGVPLLFSAIEMNIPLVPLLTYIGVGALSGIGTSLGISKAVRNAEQSIRFELFDGQLRSHVRTIQSLEKELAVCRAAHEKSQLGELFRELQDVRAQIANKHVELDSRASAYRKLIRDARVHPSTSVDDDQARVGAHAEVDTCEKELSGLESRKRDLERRIILIKHKEGNLKIAEDPSNPGARMLLGKGAMGAVYKFDCGIHFELAGKRPHSPDDRRLLAELEAGTKVVHRNVLQYYTLAEIAGDKYVLMELLENSPPTLAEYISAARFNGTMDRQKILYICHELAKGMLAIHEKLVHRDLKPANVFVTDEGRVVISDFGLAKPIFSEPLPRDLTAQGEIMGTMAYYDPTRFYMRGERQRIKDLDKFADIYALGLVFYQILAGEHPFDSLLPHKNIIGDWIKYFEQISTMSIPTPEGVDENDPLLKLIREMLVLSSTQDLFHNPEPYLRPSAQNVLESLLGIINAENPEILELTRHESPLAAPSEAAARRQITPTPMASDTVFRTPSN